MSSTTLPSSRPVFVVTGTKETKECFNCSEMGHLSCNCPRPCKLNRGKGWNYDNSGQRGSESHGGKRGYKANLVATEGRSPNF